MEYTCDYCDATEHVTTLVDRTGKEPDVHICRDCYDMGVGRNLTEIIPVQDGHITIEIPRDKPFAV